MRLSAGTIANAAAWGVLAVLVALAVVMAAWLGFLGLLILGCATALVCTAAGLNADAPTWGSDVFAARMRGTHPDAGGEGFRRALRYYGRCGLALAAIGAAGFIWQQGWFGG